jgi:hypothetical protein
MAKPDEAAAARASALRLSHLLVGLPDSWLTTSTKPLAFHSLLRHPDPSSLHLEQLRELSSRREAMSAKRTGVEGSPDAGEEEHARKDFTHWPLKYVSLFERFLQQVKCPRNPTRIPDTHSGRYRLPAAG